MPGLSPNGQALVRNSTMGSWLRTANPWSIAATTGRLYSAAGNRLREYQNSGPGRPAARQTAASPTEPPPMMAPGTPHATRRYSSRQTRVPSSSHCRSRRDLAP